MGDGDRGEDLVLRESHYVAIVHLGRFKYYVTPDHFCGEGSDLLAKSIWGRIEIASILDPTNRPRWIEIGRIGLPVTPAQILLLQKVHVVQLKLDQLDRWLRP